jgi:hypothetical protein
MDPYYFLDLEQGDYFDENDDKWDIHDYCDVSPCGGWILSPVNFLIIYNDKNYKEIIFDNNTKIITFTSELDEKITKKVTLI